MRNLLFLICIISSFQSFSQVNRYSNYSTSSYEPMSLSEMAAPILMKKKLDKERECREFLNLVQSNFEGSIYNSPNSEAISKVTFYTANLDGQVFHFAAVCFNDPKSYGCREYLYSVDPDTERKYSGNYNYSAGEAFWDYIQPYRDRMSCGPNFN